MNFGDIWQEHKKYITTLVAGLVGVLVVKLIFGMIYDSKIERAEGSLRRSKEAEARALPAGVDVEAVKRDREALAAEFEKLRAAVHRVPRAEMTLQGGVGDADLHYNAQIDRIRNGVLEFCALRNIDVDRRLGLPEAFPSSRYEVEHYLRGLDAIEQIAALCVAAEQNLQGGVARLDNLSIEKPAKLKTGGPARQEPFLKTLRVEATIVGHPRAIDEILRGCASGAPGDRPGEVPPGRRLVVQEATIKSLDIGPGAVARDRRGRDPEDFRRVELRLKAQVFDVSPEGRL
jgi:hypothetical protein